MSDRFVDISSIVHSLDLSHKVLIKESFSDDELAHLYKNASAFVYPSKSEGFGLPLLEAMHFEVPIASSDASCLPEIAGDAVAYFDPHSPGSIARAIGQLLENEALRKKLVEKGRARVKEFTWTKTAEQLLSVFMH
jgi:glycosyltransferase involved in cell wall biosynthesis